jgi:glucosyl-dolichyl phosphate glucuronosyltransferase
LEDTSGAPWPDFASDIIHGDKMLVSVAICTWNRARLLDQTLSQFMALQAPQRVDWELLVVNNRCTDTTDEVIAKYRAKLPIRRLYEDNAGKSHAANLAVKESAGELILWTDDDVLVGPQWLKAYVEAAHAYPQAAFFGGEVHPWFEKTPPGWIARHMHRLWCVFAQRIATPAQNAPIQADYLPLGANMGMRKEFLGPAPFDVKLGPLSGDKFGGEETRVLEELLRRGHHGVWVKDAAIRHFIFAERLTKAYVWNWFRWHARTTMKMDCPAVADNVPMLLGVPRWVVRRYIEQRMWSCLYAPFKNRLWLDSFTKAATYLGIWEEFLEIRRRGVNDATTMTDGPAGRLPKVDAVNPGES